MVKYSLRLTFILLSLIILVNKTSLAQDNQFLKDEAVKYRLNGLAAQERGNLDQAMQYFQKAISINPGYAIVHNDLGIIYEEKGWLERAESEYLEAVKIDPNYLPAYTNLALVYEGMNNMEKAVQYWRMRASLGLESDPWTIKAKENLKRLNAPLKEPVIIDQEAGIALEREILEEAESFSKSVALDKQTKLDEVQIEFNEHKTRGQEYFSQGKFDLALEEFRLARRANPYDEEVNILIEDAEAKYIEEMIKEHFENGLKFYQQRDLVQAQQEFRKILNILSTIQEGQNNKEEAYTVSSNQ